MKTLNYLNALVQERIADRDPAAFQAASIQAELMKLRHGLTLCESQGSVVLARFLERLATRRRLERRDQGEPAARGGPGLRRVSWPRPAPGRGSSTRSFPWSGPWSRSRFRSDPASRIIVFASYRDTVQALAAHLSACGIPSERFVGQASRDAEKGLSQKQQIDALRRFRAGEFRVLVATSVGEEGLDIPSTDLVIFYEAVPSEIRSIQRKGQDRPLGRGPDRGADDEGHLGRDLPLHLAVAREVHAEGPGADAGPRRPGSDGVRDRCAPRRG